MKAPCDCNGAGRAFFSTDVHDASNVVGSFDAPFDRSRASTSPPHASSHPSSPSVPHCPPPITRRWEDIQYSEHTTRTSRRQQSREHARRQQINSAGIEQIATMHRSSIKTWSHKVFEQASEREKKRSSTTSRTQTDERPAPGGWRGRRDARREWRAGRHRLASPCLHRFRRGRGRGLGRGEGEAEQEEEGGRGGGLQGESPQV